MYSYIRFLYSFRTALSVLQRPSELVCAVGKYQTLRDPSKSKCFVFPRNYGDIFENMNRHFQNLMQPVTRTHRKCI